MPTQPCTRTFTRARRGSATSDKAILRPFSSPIGKRITPVKMADAAWPGPLQTKHRGSLVAWPLLFVCRVEEIDGGGLNSERDPAVFNTERY